MALMNASINGRIYDVIDEDEYIRNSSLYYGQYGYVAILKNNMLYPVKSRYDEDSAGMYDSGSLLYYTDPRENNREEYNGDKVINFSKAKNYKEVIEAKQRVMSEERFILTNADNIFKPEIGQNDTPEMVALKQVICDKNIDIDKYEPRFGPNYNNDKRLLKKGSITFGKLRSICDALDIKATITFEDINSDVPNPIGRVVTTEITNTGDDTESGEE